MYLVPAGTENPLPSSAVFHSTNSYPSYVNVSASSATTDSLTLKSLPFAFLETTTVSVVPLLATYVIVVVSLDPGPPIFSYLARSVTVPCVGFSGSLYSIVPSARTKLLLG